MSPVSRVMIFLEVALHIVRAALQAFFVRRIPVVLNPALTPLVQEFGVSSGHLAPQARFPVLRAHRDLVS